LADEPEQETRALPESGLGRWTEGPGPALRIEARKAILAMSELEQARSRDERYRDRRADERFEINTPGGNIHYKGSKYPCKIIDISLSGCCVRTETPFLPGSLANVEVVLPIHGMFLRMVGTTQWVTRENLIGIRFMHTSPRSKNQLAGLLTCLVDTSAADAVREVIAVAVAAQNAGRGLVLEIPDALLQSLRRPRIPLRERVEQAPSAPQSPSALRAPAEKPAQSHLRAVRFAAEEASSAVLRFLKSDSRLTGVIVGLSKEGCSFQTGERFPAGIYVRVEVEFQMRGLHFRLIGVTENLRDQRTADIRFLDMSLRKRGELAELIGELQEANKAQC